MLFLLQTSCNIYIQSENAFIDQCVCETRFIFFRVANLSQDQCREAMFEFVAANCCYGKGCAEDMDMTDVSPSTALHVSTGTYISRGGGTKNLFTCG